ncbi:unnamed protein product [Arabis nemorensis]|uniref:DUF4283 domain-containing protein n=1 Tax=Arabis nemorensis TaxID=586526 RepID=A0A565BYJ1_9BRAS|nr:unnamed protein product [Arabis nemorensis]
MGDTPPLQEVPPDLLFLSSDPILTHVPVPDLVVSRLQSVDSTLVLPCTSPRAVPTVPLSSPVATSPWISKFKSSFHNLSKVASPSFSDDGTPMVKAPASITLGSSQIWKDHLVAYFHGIPPSPAKIFSDLNPIWGKQGRISVKHQSARICLIYIPCAITRQWVLDVGFWNSGNCSFTVSPWSPSADLSPMKLVHAPVWVLFKKVPPELWSLVGFSTIASGVGIPVHSEFPKLSPYSNGVVKLKVVVELEKKQPSSVIVTDNLGNSVMVSAEFPKLPPRCGSCLEFGHLDLRCPTPAARAISPVHPTRVSPSPLDNVGENFNASSMAPGISISEQHVPAVVRTNNSPSFSLGASEASSSGGWLRVVNRSKPRLSSSESASKSIHPVTSATFAEEEDMIKAAQVIMRQRIADLEVQAPSFVSASVRKKARRILRQKLLLLSASEPCLDPPVVISKSVSTSFNSRSVSKEQLRLQSVPLSNV